MKSLLLWGVFGLGLFIIGSGIYNGVQVQQAKSWPVATGTVVESKIIESDQSMDVDIAYQFEVNGTRYNDSDYVVDVHSSKVPPQFETGQEIAIHYAPGDPERSYLTSQGHVSTIFVIILGSLIVLVCSPFIAIQVLLGYADLMLRKAQRHMEAGMAAIGEGQDELDAIRARYGNIPTEFLDQEDEILSRAQEAQDMFHEVKKQRDAFRS